MDSFLDMELVGRRKYIARLLGYDADAPATWPLDTIDRVIVKAAQAADRAAWSEVRNLTQKN